MKNRPVCGHSRGCFAFGVSLAVPGRGHAVFGYGPGYKKGAVSRTSSFSLPITQMFKKIRNRKTYNCTQACQPL